VATEGGGGFARAENRGWKDTVIISGETQILARFDHPAGPETPFMYHCHILEHEDAGMMGQFTVT
jgi:FtsP/CotA-like multicopper oxidase with cupredoxin domain